MGEAGDVPTRKSVLHVIEAAAKEDMLYGHTERLAIAFRFIITNPGTPTHITDHLHLCDNFL